MTVVNVKPGNTLLNISLTSKNGIDSYFKLLYSENKNINVYFVDSEPSDLIKSNEEKTYKLFINNSSKVSYELYSTKLADTFDEGTYNSLNEVTELMTEVSLPQKTDTIYIMYPDGSYHDANGAQLEFSPFWIKYTNEFSIPQNSMIYDYYGFDTRGALKKLEINGDNYYVGIQYDLTSYVVLVSNCFYFGYI